MNKALNQRLPKCKNCKTPFVKKSAFACCSMACGLDYLEKAKAKKEAREKQNAERGYKKDLAEFNRKDIRWQHKRCQPVFNKLRRLQELKWFKERGLEPICISCSGVIGGDIWCNGHFKSVGSSSYLRYDFKNSYLQHNVRCNSALSADINGTATTHGYKKGLELRFGEVEAKSIINYCEFFSAVVHRFEWQDLERMRKEWNKEIREIEKYLLNAS